MGHFKAPIQPVACGVQYTLYLQLVLYGGELWYQLGRLVALRDGSIVLGKLWGRSKEGVTR